MSRVALFGPTRVTGGDGEASQATVEVTIDLDAGARIAAVRLVTGDATIDLLATPPHDADPQSTGWGSFPMAPWAGRLRHGRFGNGDDTVFLDRSHRDGDGQGGAPVRPPVPALVPSVPGTDPDIDDEPFAHAIHGTAFGRPWQIETQTASAMSAICQLGDETDPMTLGWPFGGFARQLFRVTDRSIQVTLEVHATHRSFPAVIGWHPWFPKPADIHFAPTSMYEVDPLGLPTGRLVDAGPPPWDDCFIADGPVDLHYDRATAPVIRVTSDCDHWVVYDKPVAATCVEPQSGPADAANRPRWEVPPDSESPTEVVTPGAPLRRTMAISW